jgi:hypothetical protein
VIAPLRTLPEPGLDGDTGVAISELGMMELGTIGKVYGAWDA